VKKNRQERFKREMPEIVDLFELGAVADEPFTITDQSYDPDGDPIVAREWKVQKSDGTWVVINEWKPTFEEMGLGDDGT
jgi:hypothetical protein